MLSQLLLAVCLSITVSGKINVNYECPDDLSGSTNLEIYGENCYQFVTNEKKEFSDARDYCLDNGGTLAIVKSDDVNTFIADTLKETYGIESEPVWIGLVYQGGRDGYKWVDGSRLSSVEFHHFRGTEGDDDEDCVAIIPLSKVWHGYECDSHWLDLFSSTKKRFVCQYPAVQIWTTPSTSISDSSTRLPFHENTDGCPKNVRRDKYLQVYNNTCYMFEMDMFRTFHDADVYCRSGNGRLATVDSKELDKFIQDTLNKTYNLRLHAAWIGLQYDSRFKSHLWIDGTPLSFTNFRYQKFQLSDQCTAISANDGKWLSKHCRSASLPFVCEFKMTMTTTTTKPTPTATPTTTQIPTTMPASTTVPTTDATTRPTAIITPATATTAISLTTRTTTSTTTTRTTTKPSTTRVPMTTKTKKTRCPVILCTLDCGLDGYREDPQTGCTRCECFID